MLQFFALSSFSEWQENVGRESLNFSQVNWRATVSLVASCSWLQSGKMFRNKSTKRVVTART